MDCVLPTYDVLTEDQVRLNNDNSYIVKHSRLENIFSQDKPKSHLMFLSSGLVKIYKKDQNNKSIINFFLLPGNIRQVN